VPSIQTTPLCTKVVSRPILSLQVLDRKHSHKSANHIRIDDAARFIASECDDSDSPLACMIWRYSHRSRKNTAISVSSQPTDSRMGRRTLASTSDEITCRRCHTTDSATRSRFAWMGEKIAHLRSVGLPVLKRGVVVFLITAMTQYDAVGKNVVWLFSKTCHEISGAKHRTRDRGVKPQNPGD